MSYFNTITYDASNVAYNTELPIYLDGTTSSIPVNGTKYYGNVFGNVMCSFIVDGGDSILGGNVLVSQNICLGGGLNILPVITTITGNAGNVVVTNTRDVPTFITGQSLSCIAGASSNLQNQLSSLSINSLLAVTTGKKNFSVGDYNLPALYNENCNVAVGTDCLAQNNGGNNNVAIGTGAGSGVTGDDTICIRSQTGFYPKNSFSRSTCIGYQSTITASDQFNIGNSSTSVKIPGRLDVSGNILLLGNLICNSSTITNQSLSYLSGASSNLQTQLDKISYNTMKKMTTGLYNVALGQNNLNNCATGSYNVALGYNAMNYAVNCYNSICIGSGAGYNITASDNICIGTNTGTDTVNGFSRSVCIGYCSKITQSNQLVLGNGDTVVTILGAVSAGSTVISNLSLGYLSGTTSNIQGQISTVSDNSNLALSKITSIQSSVKIIGDNIADLFSRTDGQLTGTGLTIFNNTVNVQGQLKQNSSGFNAGYYILAGCDTSVTYNFGTDYGVYMISFSVNINRYWTMSSYVHVLRTVSGGSFIIPLFQGSNEMNQSIDTGTNIFTIYCANRGGILKIMKISSY